MSGVVHDLQAFLAERVLEMDKQKQTEVKGFLGWLESYLGAKVEDLTPKIKLQGYYEHYYASFLMLLKNNKKMLAIDPSRREPAELLRAKFEGSLDKLGPLRDRIRQMDELIVATAYGLHWLAEEEIRIAEGTKSNKARKIPIEHCKGPIRPALQILTLLIELVSHPVNKVHISLPSPKTLYVYRTLATKTNSLILYF
jgi:hypothetical protein